MSKLIEIHFRDVGRMPMPRYIYKHTRKKGTTVGTLLDDALRAQRPPNATNWMSGQ